MIISWKNIFCSKEVKLGLKSPISDGLFCLELQFSTLFYFFRQSWKFSSCHRRSKPKQSKWKKSRVFVYFRIFFHCFFWYVYLIYKRKRKLTRWKLREKKRYKIFLAFCVLRDDYHLFFFAFKSDSQVSLLNWKLKNYEQGKVRRKKSFAIVVAIYFSQKFIVDIFWEPHYSSFPSRATQDLTPCWGTSEIFLLGFDGKFNTNFN